MTTPLAHLMNQVCELAVIQLKIIYSNQTAANMVTESKDKNHDHVTMIEDRITKDNHVNKDLTTNANKFRDNARGSHDKLGSYKYVAIEPSR
jgi:hypothetical protein